MEDLLKQLLVGQNKLVESVGNIEKKLVEHDEQFEILRADVKSLKAEQREMKEDISSIKENQQEMLFEVLDTIPAKNAQAFILHVFEGFTRKEIASKMGITVSAVEKHIIRATEKIKDKLKDIEGYN